MITQAQLLKSHYYNPETGLFYKRMKAGQLKEVGSVVAPGHLNATVNYTKYYVHRLAWLYMAGTWPDGEIDHIDGNPANNAWNNLRDGSRQNNAGNQKKATTRNKSGLLGVSLSGKKFKAVIVNSYKSIHLGTFDTPEEAHQAYIEAKRELHSFNTL